LTKYAFESRAKNAPGQALGATWKEISERAVKQYKRSHGAKSKNWE
jgi:hypothetical protein